ncbi:hypothetical protein BJ742DRAFT_742248 [Cladochytrium replicatum]|nr:hypothetical protein BJ742DRAFT_742248 [Cladochytrium replicatum]
MDDFTFALIAGALSAVVLLLILVSLFLCYLLRRRQRRATKYDILDNDLADGLPRRVSTKKKHVEFEDYPSAAGQYSLDRYPTGTTAVPDFRDTGGSFDVSLPLLPQDKDEEELPVYIVVKEFIGVKSDEMTLRIGDEVAIQMAFTDGMVHGYNKTSGKLGLFPIANVKTRSRSSKNQPSVNKIQQQQELAQHQIEKPSRQSSPPGPPPAANEGATATINRILSKKLKLPRVPTKRQSNIVFSMVPPEQALAIVTESLSAERRQQYFANLVMQGEADPNDPKIRASLEGASDSTPPRRGHPLEPVRTSYEVRDSIDTVGRVSTSSNSPWRHPFDDADAVRSELQMGWESWQTQRAAQMSRASEDGSLASPPMGGGGGPVWTMSESEDAATVGARASSRQGEWDGWMRSSPDSPAGRAETVVERGAGAAPFGRQQLAAGGETERVIIDTLETASPEMLVDIQTEALVIEENEPDAPGGHYRRETASPEEMIRDEYDSRGITIMIPTTSEPIMDPIPAPAVPTLVFDEVVSPTRTSTLPSGLVAPPRRARPVSMQTPPTAAPSVIQQRPVSMLPPTVTMTPVGELDGGVFRQLQPQVQGGQQVDDRMLGSSSPGKNWYTAMHASPVQSDDERD